MSYPLETGDNTMARKLVAILASTVDAYHRCRGTGNAFAGKHSDMLCELVIEHMPSGSGFDAGTILDLEKSTGEKLVFITSFHHMNEHGSYDGWTTLSRCGLHFVSVSVSMS